MQLQAEHKQWRRRVFASTWLAYAGFYFCRKPFFLLKKELEINYGWDAHVLGQLGALYLFAYAAGGFLAGWAGNRYGARLTLLVGMGVSIFANLVFGLTDSINTFGAFLIINGLAQGTGWANTVGTMANWFRRKERGTVMGFWATNYQVGGALATALAAWVVGQKYGFQWSFFAGSIVLFAIWIFFIFNQRNRPEDLGLPPIVSPPAEGSAEARAGADGGWPREVIVNVLLVGTFYFFVKFIRYAFQSWTPYLLATFYDMETTDAGYLSTVFEISGVAGVITCGYLSDRVFLGRRTKISLIFIVCMAFACGLMYLLGPTSLILFTISMGLVGFTLYGPDALMTGAGAIEAGSVRRATLAAGIINAMGSVGGIVQELLLGQLLQTGSVTAVFGTLLTSSVFAGFCLCLLLWRNKRGEADV
jgi:MFS transporter, OPA family, sugar phosphate sensor protein UhpC